MIDHAERAWHQGDGLLAEEWFDKDISGMPDDQEFRLRDGTVVTGAQVKRSL